MLRLFQFAQFIFGMTIPVASSNKVDIHEQKTTLSVIKSTIKNANPKAEGLKSSEDLILISNSILRITKCLNLDPYIFTSLIWRESNFKPLAKSHRGAVGLSQMTSAGIQEVFEKLTLSSPRKSKELRLLILNCDKTFLEKIEYLKKNQQMKEWKKLLTETYTHSIYMGAVLLKIYLMPIEDDFNLSSQEKYQLALERYNGDPRIKKQFSKDIFTLARFISFDLKVVLNDSVFLRKI